MRNNSSSTNESEFINNLADREARNSTGGKEEFLGPRLSTDSSHLPLSMNDDHDSAIKQKDAKKDGHLLGIIFGSMVFIGLGNRVFNKLMTIPMHNYPNFLNLLTTFVYIPVCFSYIIPMSRNGGIPADQVNMSKRPFMVMGTLDALASIMQIFGSTYLPGPLVILLLQAAIPVSMIISKYLIKVTYTRFQYLGAAIVACGILTVLAPTLSSGGSIVWCLVLMLSTVPMTLSSVYKEIALGEKEIDPIFLNGWIAVFQFMFSLLICIPSSLISDPPVPIPELPQNMVDGLMCYFGKNSKTCPADDSSCVPDNCFPQGPAFVTTYLFFNQLYNLLIILLLKYGSANLLYMALTIMVPLGNVAFTLDFVPQHQTLRATDIIGLVIICLGLGCYRFAGDLYVLYKKRIGRHRHHADSSGYFEDGDKRGLEQFKQTLLTDDDDKDGGELS